LRAFKQKKNRQPEVQSSQQTTDEEADLKAAVFWPRDLLPSDVPDVRVLTFGYDANISSILSKSANGSIFTIAQDLITRLEMFREGTNTSNIPLIFAAHSLGGLVVKDVSTTGHDSDSRALNYVVQALKFSQDQEGFQSHLHSIFKNAYGVIFFGTPHRGSEMASLGMIAARIAGLGLAESDCHLLRSLEKGSAELQRIGDSFSRMLPQVAKALKVYTFQEGLPVTSAKFAGKVSRASCC
jgi:hypothetical protein